jgi:hypothetical protein
MNIFSRVTIGLLWIVGSMTATANTIWTEGIFGDAGPLPASAQMIWGDNQPLDGIFGNLASRNGADMFRIWITDPLNFTADVFPDTSVDPNNQLIPQIFLFDNGGLPMAGGFAAYVGGATLPPWFSPDVPGYYYLMVNSVGRDPIFKAPDPITGTLTKQPLFCADPFTPSYWACPGAETQPIEGYKGQGVYSGAYIIALSGVTAPMDPSAAPEPGTVFLLLSGAVLMLAHKRHYRAANQRLLAGAPRGDQPEPPAECTAN